MFLFYYYLAACKFHKYNISWNSWMLQIWRMKFQCWRVFNTAIAFSHVSYSPTTILRIGRSLGSIFHYRCNFYIFESCWSALMHDWRWWKSKTISIRRHWVLKENAQDNCLLKMTASKLPISNVYDDNSSRSVNTLAFQFSLCEE